jgi:hypothetical protein
MVPLRASTVPALSNSGWMIVVPVPDDFLKVAPLLLSMMPAPRRDALLPRWGEEPTMIPCAIG